MAKLNTMSNDKVTRVAKTGNEVIAEAMRQINPDVVAAYPITPQTEIVMLFSQFVADGAVETEYIPVESEHSAMSAAIGASAAGARVMTATCSQGLALMHEMLYIASGLRLPIVMPVVNRALSAPINIHCDHSDTMGSRDCGWIQIYSENAQEAYDNVIQAVVIAEKVLLPVMVCIDGFIISHCMEVVEILPDEAVKSFVKTYKPKRSLLDVNHPYTLGALDFTDYYFEHKRSQAEAMYNAKEIITSVTEEYYHQFHRKYDLVEKYFTDDAEMIIVVIGSTAGTAKTVVDGLRSRGKKVGLLKVRFFRPFPYKELTAALKSAKAVAVMDRTDSIAGFAGPLFTEVRSALYDEQIRPLIVNYIYGLGGRDINPSQIETVYTDLENITLTGKIATLVKYLGVRE